MPSSKSRRLRLRMARLMNNWFLKLACRDHFDAVVKDSTDGKQKVADCTLRCAILLEQETTEAALGALKIISEASFVRKHSEKLLQMKARALYLLQRYEEVIQVCEPSLGSTQGINSRRDQTYTSARLWRWIFISKSYFQLGKFEAALDFLKKLEQVGALIDNDATTNLESLDSGAVTIRELLSHFQSGNEAIKSGRHTEAVEHYTVALSSNIGSRPFAAICLSRRAQAHQALSQITDAIADCSLAIALCGDDVTAVYRRATLHEMIRDYELAASDIQQLISILEKQSDIKASEELLEQSYRRLAWMENKAKKGIPLNYNLILGTKQSDTSSSIKKAYHTAARKHHPDKAAGQFLARSEKRDEGQLWKDICVEVQKDAGRLFKIIGEAYAVLSDPIKREKYDLEEEKCRKSANERKENCRSDRKPGGFQYPRPSSYDFQCSRTSTAHFQSPRTNSSGYEYPRTSSSGDEYPRASTAHFQSPRTNSSHFECPGSSSSYFQSARTSSSYFQSARPSSSYFQRARPSSSYSQSARPSRSYFQSAGPSSYGNTDFYSSQFGICNYWYYGSWEPYDTFWYSQPYDAFLYEAFRYSQPYEAFRYSQESQPYIYTGSYPSYSQW